MDQEQPIRSLPYHPKNACEKCVFDRGEHAEWCPESAKFAAIASATAHSVNRQTLVEQGWIDE
jgi:hypothetical protein